MSEFKQKEKYTGELNHKVISFNRVWSTHRFTDEECVKLCDGQTITFTTKNKEGKDYTVSGKLEEQEYNGHKFYGFKPDFSKTIPDEFNGYIFSQEQKKELDKGQIIYVQGLISKKTGNSYNAYLKFDKDKGLQMSFSNEE